MSTNRLKRKLRDYLRLSFAVLFLWLYIPHLVVFFLGGSKWLIQSDLKRMKKQTDVCMSIYLYLLYMLRNNSYFRSLFYHRIGPVYSMLIGWWRPGDKYFSISKTTKIGEGMLIAHPYATILNAESIGKNFSCIHLTTLGAKEKGRPVIGDNVSLGANVTIIGNVHIGNNVVVGAGSVVVKDVPNNCIIAGNPARIIRYMEIN